MLELEIAKTANQLSREEHTLAPSRIDGRLSLSFARKDGQTVLRVVEQQQPLKVVRAFPLPDSACLTHLHNVSGGVLGGDQLTMSIEVEPGAAAQITTTGATRLYKSLPNIAPALQQTRVTVGAGALLEYFPDPLIPFAGSKYRQETRIDLAENAGLCWWEIVAPGRVALGELFAYALLQTKRDTFAAGQPIAAERHKLEPKLRPLSSPARLGPYRYYATLYICKVGEPESRWRELEAALSATAQQLGKSGAAIWGVSTLPAHGLVVRALATNGRDLTPGLFALWREAKQELLGQPVIIPRKVN